MFAQFLGGKIGVTELLLILTVLFLSIFVVRPLWRLLWAIIHKLER